MAQQSHVAHLSASLVQSGGNREVRRVRLGTKKVRKSQEREQVGLAPLGPRVRRLDGVARLADESNRAELGEGRRLVDSDAHRYLPWPGKHTQHQQGSRQPQ